MIKTIISTMVAAIIIFAGTLVEQNYLKKTFSRLEETFTICYNKVDAGAATPDDLLAAQQCWLGAKEHLHICIPHTEIKELDLWLSEAVCLVKEKNYPEALIRLEVVIELTQQIPKTFLIRVENIF